MKDFVLATVVGVFMIAFIVVSCVGVAIIGSSMLEPSVEDVQHNAATIQFHRQLCREDCFPGTLKNHNPYTNSCECYPAVP